MNPEISPDKEKEIIGKLFVREEDTIKNLEKIVTTLTRFIKIEESSGRVIFLKKNLGIEQKIFLVLIGKYFYDRSKNEGNGELDLAFIAKTIGKPITTMPIFIQRLIEAGLITKVSRGTYKANYHKTDDFLSKLEQKEGDNGGS